MEEIKLYRKEIRAVWEEVGDLHFILSSVIKSDWQSENTRDELMEKYKVPDGMWCKLVIEERYVPIKSEEVETQLIHPL